MLDWIGLVIVPGCVTVVLAVYMLITKSAGIYPTSQQFWRAALLSAGIAYPLSGSMYLFLHLNATIAVVVSAVVPFLVGTLVDLGEQARPEGAPTVEGLEPEALSEDGEAEEAPTDAGDEAVYQARGEHGGDVMVVYHPEETRALWN